MNKTLFALASVFLAAATAATAGGSTKGTGGVNGRAKSGLTSERVDGPPKGLGPSVLRTVPAAGSAAQASMNVISVSLPIKFRDGTIN